MPLIKELFLFLIINCGHVETWLALFDILAHMFRLIDILRLYKDVLRMC